MDCRQCRKLIMTTRGLDRTQADLERIAAHQLRCEACTSFLAKAAALESLLQTGPAPVAPPDFTRRVMERARASREPARAAWHEALFGALRVPSPPVTLRQAVAAVALVLMVVSVGLWVGQGIGVRPGAQTPTISVAESGNGQVIQMDKAFVEEVIARHQSAAAMQPLSDDDGMRLVSY